MMMIIPTTATTTKISSISMMKTLLFHPSASIKVLFILCVIFGSSSIIHTHIWTVSNLNSTDQSTTVDNNDLFDSRYLRSTSTSSQLQQTHGPLNILQEQQRLSSITNDNRKRAIFYNIFVPDDDDGNGTNRTRAIDIVREQLSLKDELSTVLRSSNVPIYYTLIGNNPDNHKTSDEIQKICGGSQSNCNQIQYVPKGDESLTLQSLWEYCTDHPDVQVTYIHNKGSYHPSERNENFRVMLSKGVFSDDCQIGMNHPINDDNNEEETVGEGNTDTTTAQKQKQQSSSSQSQTTCNICGSRFSSFPHYHMAGNMWTSQCSYIRQLIPPNRFINKMEEMFDSVMLNPNPSVPRPTFQQYKAEWSLGRNRFAYEHWATSHPYVKPCDVFPGRYTHGYRDLPSRHYSHWRPKLQLGPRWSMDMFLKISMIRGEWFCGQARIVEFQYLYNLTPKKDSFVWDYYLKPYKGCDIPLNRTTSSDIIKHDSSLSDSSANDPLLSSSSSGTGTGRGGRLSDGKLTTNIPIQLSVLKEEGEY